MAGEMARNIGDSESNWHGRTRMGVWPHYGLRSVKFDSRNSSESLYTRKKANLQYFDGKKSCPRYTHCAETNRVAIFVLPLCSAWNIDTHSQSASIPWQRAEDHNHHFCAAVIGTFFSLWARDCLPMLLTIYYFSFLRAFFLRWALPRTANSILLALWEKCLESQLWVSPLGGWFSY